MAVAEKRVKWRAFLPSNKDHRTSVFCTGGLSLREVWQLAVDHVEPKRGPVLGGGELTVGAIENLGLHVVCDEPPPNHANIDAWPTDKDDWKLLAQQLAELANLHVR